MKPYLAIVLTLFSISSSSRLKIEEYRCEDNTIEIKYEEKWYDITLFNVVLKKDIDVCKYMQGDVAIEFEETIDYQNDNAVYVFVEEKLLQKTLYENEEAIIINPSIAYKYTIKEEKIPVFKETETAKKEYPHSSLMIGCSIVVGYIAFCLFVCLLKLANRKRRNK